MTKTAVRQDEKTKQLEGELAQRDRQIVVLEERNRQLAGFQNEVQDLRDTLTHLTADLEAANEATALANADAAAARAHAKNTLMRGSADVKTVEAALQLRDALKKLI